MQARSASTTNICRMPCSKTAAPNWVRSCGRTISFTGEIFEQHIDLAVRADGYLPEGHHVEAFFKVGICVRKLRQRLVGQLHPNKFQRAVSTGVFQSAALTGLEDDEILLLCGQHQPRGQRKMPLPRMTRNRS